MVQIPDSIRPALAIFVKYHFWMLAAIVPVALVPLLFMANGKLRAEIQSHRGRIDGKFGALRGVDGQNPHPNEAWSTKIVANTKNTKRETLAAWTVLWLRQQPLRQWPAALGDEFVKKVATLKPGTELPRKMLERYQEIVRQLVRELPGRMGADDHMRDESAEEAAAGGPPPGPRPQRGLVDWTADDQRAVYAAFNWLQTPSTTQVLLAQEELWAYGLLCKVVKEMNGSASGRYNAPITAVSRLAIGYPAAEEIPGCSGRIMAPEKAGGEGLPPLPAASPRPQNPRFGGKPATTPPPPPDDPGAAGGPPDDPLKNWLYVDFDGKPLLATESVSNPAAQMVHLLPFVMRITIDQRSLDSLLVKLASSSVPIEVRQLRINTDAVIAPSAGSPPPAPAGGSAAPSADRPRLHDIRVEIRGTICLATPPNPALIGLEAADLESVEQPADAAPVAEGEPPVAAPAPAAPVEAAP